MNSDPRHAQPGGPVDPLVATPGEIDPSELPPMPPPPDIAPDAGVAELRQLLIEFSQSMYRSMSAIPAALRSLDSRTGLLRRILYAFLAVIVIDVIFTLGLGVGLKTTWATQGQLTATQQQLKDAIVQLNRVNHSNCFLYGLVIPNYHGGNSPQRLSYPGGPVAYDQLFIGMQQTSDHDLNCGIKHSVPGT